MSLKDNIKKSLEKIKEQKKRKFAQSIDLTINLKEFDVSKPENRINEEIILPHGTGKETKIAVFGGGELSEKAKNVADLIIDKDELQELAKDKKKVKKMASTYSFFIAQSDYMPLIGKTLGPVLGPRGKLPKPVMPNTDIAPLVQRLRKTVKVRTKDNTALHLAVGTEKMEDEKIAENAAAAIEHIERKLPKGAANIGSIYIKSTMGEKVRIEV